MNDSIREKHQRALSINDAATAQAMANYQQAQAAGDQDAEDTAIQDLAGLRATRVQINQMAQEAMTPPAPAYGSNTPGQDNTLSRADVALCQQYGVSPHILEIGTCWTNDQTMTKAQKLETWLRNNQRHQYELANGKRDERHQQRGY
jgi:hypothetical protein